MLPRRAWPLSIRPRLDFDFREVLNHRIENLFRLRRGDLREGWLLAMGYKPVPAEYGLGRPAPVEVRLLDQFSRVNVASVELAVERSTKPKQLLSAKRPGLFEPEEAPVPMECPKGEDLRVPLWPLIGVDVAKQTRK